MEPEKPSKRRIWWILGIATALAAVVATVFWSSPHRLGQALSVLDGIAPKQSGSFIVDFTEVSRTHSRPPPMIAETQVFEVEKPIAQVIAAIERDAKGNGQFFAAPIRQGPQSETLAIKEGANTSHILLSSLGDRKTSISITQIREANWFDQTKTWFSKLFFKNTYTQPTLSRK